jgi:hypothetical protein
MELGCTVNSIRNNNRFSAYKQELKEMGFDFENQIYDWEKVKRALMAYKSIEGNLLVPYNFTIPVDDASWEPDLWGMELGYTVRSMDSVRDPDIEQTTLDSEQGRKLLEEEFDNVILMISRWENLRKALLAYMSEYEDFVPSDYSWAHDLYFMNLEEVAKYIKSKNGFKAHRQELEDMGFY